MEKINVNDFPIIDFDCNGSIEEWIREKEVNRNQFINELTDIINRHYELSKSNDMSK
ncbi:hypothetical protein [Ornithinibacillus sp. FSL M8-0202]|uniref:hypothetical protein n=1 Tax=Ornithinibacillus sp. FSL M8-0202 TaxID=2921616 RepID=UPI0030CCAA1B